MNGDTREQIKQIVQQKQQSAALWQKVVSTLLTAAILSVAGWMLAIDRKVFRLQDDLSDLEQWQAALHLPSAEFFERVDKNSGAIDEIKDTLHSIEKSILSTQHSISDARKDIKLLGDAIEKKMPITIRNEHSEMNAD